MKISRINVILPIVILSACYSTNAQNLSLDSTFKANISVVDSVAYGQKRQSDLNAQQSAFLYLITDWSGSDAQFNHYEGIKLNRQHVKKFRDWYSRFSTKIDFNEFSQAMEIQERFFNEGIMPEMDVSTLSRLSAKYHSLIEQSSEPQFTNITGKVIDENDFLPMPLVKIYDGDSVIGITDSNGEFNIKLADSANELLFTWISYEPTSIKIPKDCKHLEIILRVDVIYDYISARRVNRKRYRHFKSLLGKHLLAYEKDIFSSREPCVTYIFTE